MYKCLLSEILVLLAASGAWGAIGQAQHFEIGVNNVLEGVGVGTARSSELTVIGQAQRIAGSHHSAAGVQKEAGVYFRTSEITGPEATRLTQRADIKGDQMQVGGCLSPRLQGQHLRADFTTEIVMPSGPGSARGGQGFVGGQMQTMSSGRGSGSQAQLLIVVQRASVVGTEQTDPTVTNSLHVDLSQGQVDTTRYVPHRPH